MRRTLPFKWYWLLETELLVAVVIGAGAGFTILLPRWATLMGVAASENDGAVSSFFVIRRGAVGGVSFCIDRQFKHSRNGTGSTADWQEALDIG